MDLYQSPSHSSDEQNSPATVTSSKGYTVAGTYYAQPPASARARTWDCAQNPPCDKCVRSWDDQVKSGKCLPLERCYSHEAIREEYNLAKKGEDPNNVQITRGKLPGSTSSSNEPNQYIHICIFSNNSEQYERVRALADTGSDGLWISWSLADSLGVHIYQADRTIIGYMFDGTEVFSMNTITVDWKLEHGEVRHQNTFHVCAMKGIDVIFGYDFLRENKLVVFDYANLRGLRIAKPETARAREERDAAAVRQQQDALASQERRRRREMAASRTNENTSRTDIVSSSGANFSLNTYSSRSSLSKNSGNGSSSD